MKTKILTLLAVVGFAASFSACTDNNFEPTSDSFGKLSFAEFGVSVDESQAVVESRATKQDVNTYLVTVINKATGKNVPGLNDKRFSELPGVVDLEVGTYQIKVESHNPLPAEFAHPYYVGYKDVEIVENRITNADAITCKFNSIRVSVTYSDKLKGLLGEDVKVTISYGNGAYLEFNREEDRSGYFAPVDGANTLVATVRGTINGQMVEQTKTYSNIQPGHHYTIRFKVLGPQDTGEETGMINPGEGISIDTSLVTTDENGNVKVEEEILNSDDRPGKEDPDPNETPDDPTPPTPPVDDDNISITCTDESFDINGVNIIKDEITEDDYIFDITAKNGFANIKVQIDSPFLTDEELEDVGLAKTFDLAHPGDLAEALSGLGFPVGDDVIGKEAIQFNLSGLIPLLKSGAEPGQEHKFTLTVTDQAGNVKSQTLIFKS